jgi:hypothetical protein
MAVAGREHSVSLNLPDFVADRSKHAGSGTLACMRAGAVLSLVALNCSSGNGQPPLGNSTAHVKPSLGNTVPPRIVKTPDFTIPLFDGYADITADFQKDAPQLAAVVAAGKLGDGYKATIVVQKAPLPGGTFADPVTCTQTGNGLITGGTVSPGIKGILRSAAIVDGPTGKTCQINILAAEGVSLITELHEPGNTLLTPNDVWLMTCNYADGDQNSEATCRSTLAGFRFTH